MNLAPAPPSSERLHGAFLDGVPGEMAQRVLSFDWSRTSLGPIEHWPQSLKTATAMVLLCRVPIVMLWGLDGIMIYNDGYTHFAGARHPQQLGMKVLEGWPEVADFNAHVMKVGLGGGTLSFKDQELTLYRNGAAEQVWMDLDYSPILDETGAPAGVIAIVFETTERVLADRLQAAAESARLAAETRLRELNANLKREVIERSAVGGRFWQTCPDLLGVLNAQSRFDSVNPAWTALLGWSEDEVKKASMLDLLHPDDRETTRRSFEHLTRGNPILRLENRYLRKDGGYEWFTWTAAPLGPAYYCSGRKITEEKEQALALQARTAERELLWRHSQDLLAVINTDGVFHDVSAVAGEILGWSPQEMVGKAVFDFIHPDDLADTQAALERATSTQLPTFVNRYRHKDGTYRWLSWVAAPEQGLIYATARHVTLEREQAEALVEAQEALRQAQKMEAVGQLTGGIAHDFNNLLAGISGSLELLEARIAQGRFAGIERYVNAAQTSAHRAASLTQRLLAFSRRQTLDPRPTDANRLVAGMEDLIRRTVGPSIHVEVVRAGGLWLTQIDPAQLESALLNLAINARDAMPEGGRITIETANRWFDERTAKQREVSAGQYISVCLTDTGTGMTPEVVARAFDPFFTTKPLGQGTGLGLSMVHGFVRQSGGQVRVYSELEKGTTMCLYLPRSFGELEDVAASDAPGAADTGEGEVILIIDDEPIVRMLLVEIVEEAGYTAIEAEDGPSGLKILQSDQKIDLLITDVGLPGGINGRQVADAARMTRPDLKVIFVTGYAENAVVGNGILAPGMTIVTKPFVMQDLARKIQSMIEA